MGAWCCERITTILMSCAIEVLAKYGTPEQQKKWLVPLLNGEIRSAFAMTEKNGAHANFRGASKRNAHHSSLLQKSRPRTRPTSERPSAGKATKSSSTATNGCL
jgi:hypothetical protein